jgi:hypothetical protein
LATKKRSTSHARKSKKTSKKIAKLISKKINTSSKAKPSSKAKSSSKKISEAQRQRDLAIKSHAAFLASKARSESSKKAWITRTTDPGSLYKQMVKTLEKYQLTHERNDYNQFKRVKRNLFGSNPGYASYLMARDAAIQVGWGEKEAAKFAKLS